MPIEEAAELVGGDDPFAETNLNLSMQRVGEAMQQLNPGQQEVVSLHLFGGLSAEEAGAIMGRTPGAIPELQRTALKALRNILGPEMTHLGASPRPASGLPASGLPEGDA